MQAIRIHFNDNGDELRMEEVPQPVPQAGEVLIRTQAIGVNRADLNRRRTVAEGQPEPPRIPGLDVAGVVEAVGPDVAGWRPGDAVMGLVRGAYAEYCVTPSVLAFPGPQGMSTNDVASLPCVFFTAYYAFQMAGLKAGDTALVHSAGSGVGMAGIQIAKAMGARVLTSAGSDQRVERGRELGAEAGVNYSTQDVTAELLRLTGGQGVDMGWTRWVAPSSTQPCRPWPTAVEWSPWAATAGKGPSTRSGNWSPRASGSGLWAFSTRPKRTWTNRAGTK